MSRTSAARNSAPRRWIMLRKLVQALALAAFVAFVVFGRNGGLPPDVANIPLRLDPMAVLANLLSGKAFLAGSALALFVVALTLIFGRAWCGWACWTAMVLDLLPFKRAPGGPRAHDHPGRGMHLAGYREHGLYSASYTTNQDITMTGLLYN